MMMHAPIALFAFKRPAHTRRTFESLATNLEFNESPLIVYCDGARNEDESAQVAETRKLVRDWPHPNKIIIERNRNWGLANSVIAGVTELCERFGRVIVVEDDLIVSPVFLNYLNRALEHYADEPKVMQVSGYMFPIAASKTDEVLFLPITSTWGWATWSRAWKYFGIDESEIATLLADPNRRRAFDLDGCYPYTRRLNQQLAAKSDSWGIQWYLSVFSANGLIVYPPDTLVQNMGHDGSGANCRVELAQDDAAFIFRNREISFPSKICVSVESYGEVKQYLRSHYRVIFRVLAWLRTELKKSLRILD
jgi:hypothetical protein